MVWGCISVRGISRLHRIHGNVTSEYYLKILKFCLIPSARHLFSRGYFLCMQDNAPVHTSKGNKKFLADSGVDVLG